NGPGEHKTQIAQLNLRSVEPTAEHATARLRRSRLLRRCFKQCSNVRSECLRQYMTVSNQEAMWRSTCLEGLSQIAGIINDPLRGERRKVTKRFAAGNTGFNYQQLDSGRHSPRLVETLNKLSARLAALGDEDEQASPGGVVGKVSIARDRSQRFNWDRGAGRQSHLAPRCLPIHSLDAMDSHSASDRDQNRKDSRPNRHCGQAKGYLQVLPPRGGTSLEQGAAPTTGDCWFSSRNIGASS